MAQHGRRSAEPPTDEPTEATVRVLVVEDGHCLASLLAGSLGLRINAAASLAACANALASDDAYEVVVVDPELGRQWPSTVAEQALDIIAGRAGLVVVCRTTEDQQALTTRLRQTAALVLSRMNLSGAQLAEIIRGVAGQRKAARP